LLTDNEDLEFLAYFAFVPARYDTSLIGTETYGGLGPKIWTFVTYAFLHGDFMHLAINSIWFLPFGSAMARRLGTLRFLGFFAVTAAAGAAAYLLTHPHDFVRLVGASAAVSGVMAGSVRFVFQIGGPIEMFRLHDDAAYRVRAASLAAALRDSRVIIFLLAWFGPNLWLAVGTPSLSEQSVAWEAHIGGFLAGLILFALFDPVPPQSEIKPSEHA